MLRIRVGVWSRAFGPGRHAVLKICYNVRRQINTSSEGRSIAAPYEFTCEECGDDFTGFYKNTKLCTCCRILRDVQATPNLKRYCYLCGDEFFPVRRTHKMCYNCGLQKRDFTVDATCNLCTRHIRPAPGLQNTCLPCVTATKKNRDSYVYTLLKRRLEILNITGKQPRESDGLQ